MKDFLRVLRYLRPHWKLAIASVFFIVVGSAAGLLAPWPLKVLVDSVLGSAPLPPLMQRLLGPLAADRTALVLVIVGALLLIKALQNTLTVVDHFVNARIEQNMVLDFRSDLFRHAQRLSLSFHDQSRAGGLIYAINYQAHSAAQLVMMIPPLAQSVLTLVGMIWVTYQIDRQLALLSLTVAPVLYYAVSYYMRHVQARLAQVMGMEGESLTIIHEAMSMLRVIVAFGREGYEYRRFREQGERAVDARVKLTVRQSAFSLVVNMTTEIGAALVLAFGAFHVLQGKLTVGALLVVLSYIAAVYQPLETISTTVGDSLQQSLMSLRISFGLLDIEPEIKDRPGAIALDRARGDVTFEGVHFSYKGRSDTLKDISFEVKAGQVVALVGPTGAGKTTLISLIPRFYEQSQGRILLDGIDTRQIQLKSLRDQISIVLQEPLLFSTTIAENIRYGRLDATMDEIVEAAKAANAHDFITRLPEGYHTVLGERGARLSGGERQRIAVARAFLKDAPILILDEPTSSIDSRTEAVILDALERLMEGRTTFMVAHRLATIRNADIILVLQQGELVEQGTYAELLRRGGLYKQLHDLQTGQARRGARRPPAPVEGGVLTDGAGAPSDAVEVTVLAPPDVLPVGAEAPLRLAVRNAGGLVGEAGDEGRAIRFHYHWLDDQGVMVMHGEAPAGLGDAEQAEVIECALSVRTPEAEGAYLLEFGPVGGDPPPAGGPNAPAAQLRVRLTSSAAELALLEMVQPAIYADAG